ncbi:MAG: hypothetical protein GX349_04955 [Firmicutes bacterium]|nr:hypothetical protein [Bacillota bacterium]
MTDPYLAGLFRANPFACKRPVEGELVVVLQERLKNRGLKLMMPISRAFCRGEIHELIATEEEGLGPGQGVDKIAYLGFFEVLVGGVVVCGDEVYIGERRVGTVVGFDATHLPNHINVVLGVSQGLTGTELGLGLGTRVFFRSPPER